MMTYQALQARMLDLLRNIAGFDHDTLQRASAGVMRQAIQEYQSEAMMILDEIDAYAKPKASRCP